MVGGEGCVGIRCESNLIGIGAVVNVAWGSSKTILVGGRPCLKIVEVVWYPNRVQHLTTGTPPRPLNKC